MYLETKEAAELLATAMKPRTPAERLSASAKVIESLHRIALHPDVPFDEFRAQYLRDCLASGRHEASLVFLESPSFSANEQRDLLELVVRLYLAMGKTKLATDWIGDVSYVFGAKAVRGLADKPGLEALAKNKAFLKVSGKDAEKAFFASHLAESVRMWKRGEYDNFKDALTDAKGLVKDALALGEAQQTSATKHLEAVVKRIEKEMETDPGLKAYLEGLL